MSLKRNVIANYLGAGWNALMALAFVPLYIRYLGIEAYGLLGIYAILQAWLSLLDMGMTPSLSREMAGLNVDGARVQRARDLLRSVDALGRFGGEEFMVLMPNTDLKGATDAANRMRVALTRTKLEIQGKLVPLSASFGAAVLGRNERPDDLVRRADAAMYAAKRLGRNRVEVDENPGV